MDFLDFINLGRPFLNIFELEQKSSQIKLEKIKNRSFCAICKRQKYNLSFKICKKYQHGPIFKPFAVSTVVKFATNLYLKLKFFIRQKV